ncbi:MAG: hypothetical protein JW917_09620 [Ignavibacteria bacterium]|nr:hypothetical protein [Ignavibacteria bacterium]
MELFKYYKNGFIFDDEIETGKFVEYCIKIAVKYLCYYISCGKLFLPSAITAKDAAIDLTSSMFKRKGKCLICFSNYFRKSDNKIKTDNEVRIHISKFICKTIKQNFPKFFADYAPDTHKIIRNISEAVQNDNYYSSDFSGYKFIYRKKSGSRDINLYSREEFINFINPKLNCSKVNTIKKFVDLILDSLEKQKDFFPAAAFSDLVFLYKQFILNGYHENNGTEDIEAAIDCKIIFDNAISKFYNQMDSYFCKKEFPEKIRAGLYDLFEEFTNNLINGGIKIPVKKLYEKFFPEDGIDKFHNKIEYCLQVLVKDIKKEIEIQEL